MSYPLSHYQALVDCVVCPECKTHLLPIEVYPHRGGWELKDYLTRQWLSAKCPKCRFEWSLWKLGIFGSVEHPEPEIGVLDAQ